MNKLFSLLSGLIICSAIFAQQRKSIEISFIGRSDIHGNYVSNFAGRVYNDTNKISGFSYGINGIFKHKLSKWYSLSFGVGYYQLRVDKVRGSIPFNIPGIRTARNIDYHDATRLLYSTPRYHYNNLAISIAIDKAFLIKKNFKFDIASEVIGYKSISQKYFLFSGSNYYKTNKTKPIEFGVNINVGVIKEFSKFYLRPSLLIPIYQNLKGDWVFFENSKMNIPKWFSGIGFSLKFGKYF